MSPIARSSSSSSAAPLRGKECGRADGESPPGSGFKIFAGLLLKEIFS